MADQCLYLCSRVRKFVLIFALFTYFTCSVDGEKAQNDDTAKTTAVPELGTAAQTSSDPVSSRRHIKVTKTCLKCISKCDCQFGVPTSFYSKEAKNCQRCCKRKKCSKFGYKMLNELKKAARKDRRQRDQHVYLEAVADYEAFRKKRYSKLDDREPIRFRAGDVLTTEGIMEVAGRRIKHGWMDKTTGPKTKSSPRLSYDNIRIRKSGLYMVYAQVVFRWNDDQHSSYVVRKYAPGEGQDAEGEILTQCEGTSTIKKGMPVYQTSCFTETITVLEKGSKIRVECQYLMGRRCPDIVMMGKRTYFGVVSM